MSAMRAALSKTKNGAVHGLPRAWDTEDYFRRSRPTSRVDLVLFFRFKSRPSASAPTLVWELVLRELSSEKLEGDSSRRLPTVTISTSTFPFVFASAVTLPLMKALAFALAFADAETAVFT